MIKFIRKFGKIIPINTDRVSSAQSSIAAKISAQTHASYLAKAQMQNSLPGMNQVKSSVKEYASSFSKLNRLKSYGSRIDNIAMKNAKHIKRLKFTGASVIALGAMIGAGALYNQRGKK